MPVSSALLAGMVSMIRRRSKDSGGSVEVPAYLDGEQELDVTGKKVHRFFELTEESRTPELSRQSLVEMLGQHAYQAVEMN